MDRKATAQVRGGGGTGQDRTGPHGTGRHGLDRTGSDGTRDAGKGQGGMRPYEILQSKKTNGRLRMFLPLASGAAYHLPLTASCSSQPGVN